jgi:hypothetical protein
MRGYFAILCNEEGPIQTGIGSYPTPEGAQQEAQEWALSEDLTFKKPSLVNETSKTNHMAKIKTIKELLDKEEFPAGAVVMAVAGEITGLFKIRKGTGSSGDYEYQNGKLKDATGEIEVCFSKCSQPDSAKGKKVTITSKTTNHGFQGIKIEDDSYEKDGETKHKRILKITPSADIVFVGGAPTGSTQSGGQAGPAQSGGGQTSGFDLSKHPLVIVDDIAALHSVIVDVVSSQYEKSSEALRQSYTATLFIEACKTGCAVDFIKRYKKPKAGYPAPPSDPSKWKECILPKGPFEGKTLADVPDDKLLEYYNYYMEKKDEGNMAKCVYQAAKDRDLLPKDEPQTEEEGGDDPFDK